MAAAAAAAAVSLPETAAVRKIASGKVRDLYTSPESPDTTLVFLASDRISAFDVSLSPGIPGKGALLTQLSAHWFSILPTLLPAGQRAGFEHHLVALGVPSYDALEALAPAERAALDARAMHVRKLDIIPVEAIVRGYLTGSAWAEYAARGTVHGIALPAGLQKSQKLPAPLYTPSTKAPAGQHDENIHPDRAAEIIGDAAVAARVGELALAIYAAAAAHAEARGVIIADTKFEFGVDRATGRVVLADEVLTPDSSRFWDRARYEVGRDQESFDKQAVRDWLAREGVKGKEGVVLPEDVVRETAQRYRRVYEMLTGRVFAGGEGEGGAEAGDV